jgi:hypothetical protein
MGMVKESTVELETVLSKDFSRPRTGTWCRKGRGKYYNETWVTSVVKEKQGN